MVKQVIVEELRKIYKEGVRIQLIESIDDPYTKIPAKTCGTIRNVDDIGTIHVGWDDRCTLGLVLKEDFTDTEEDDWHLKHYFDKFEIVDEKH